MSPPTPRCADDSPPYAAPCASRLAPTPSPADYAGALAADDHAGSSAPEALSGVRCACRFRPYVAHLASDADAGSRRGWKVNCVEKPTTRLIEKIQVEYKIVRLEQLKAIKTWLVLKKKTELEEQDIRHAHLIDEEGYVDEYSTGAIEAGSSNGLKIAC
ncbi:hypothetical protein ACP4OV_030961 [Aristida adscensionis]